MSGTFVQSITVKADKVMEQLAYLVNHTSQFSCYYNEDRKEWTISWPDKAIRNG